MPKWEETHREYLRLKEHERRLRFREQINARRREVYANDAAKRNQHRQEHRAWYARNRKRQVQLLRARYAALRKQAMDKLGGKCCQCGFTDSRALQIDHVHGNGNKEKQLIGQWKMYKKILKLEAPQLFGEYQLLCANCNWIKKTENNEVVAFKRNY